MRTLQEKYNAIQEGKFSKENFLADARRELPNLVTRFNGYDDAVQILKNRGMIQEARVEEARLTKNSLTDYRYKPTNDMDKYPYEQILRGLRVELEGMEVYGTPTAEEYKKALSKVLKNLEKDEIFYTNQLAGVNKKVDLHDKMVDATAKNTVDTFNGMKKVKNLKEDHTKKPGDKYTVRFSKTNNTYQVWEGDHLVTDFATKERAKAYADKENKRQDLSESVLKEGIKNLIKKALMEGEEDIYEMQGPKSDNEYKSELADYLDDNQIYGYTNRIHDIMTGPDEDEAYRELAEYLDGEGIYGYNRAIERIYADYPYDQHWMNQPDEDEADDISHPRGYEEASDEETFEDLFEEIGAGKKVTFTNKNDGEKYTGTVVRDLGNGKFTFRADQDGKVYSNDGMGSNWVIKIEQADREGIRESAQESGLMVIGRTQIDNNAIGDVLDELELHGEWNMREGYWMLPEDEENYDSLEEMLEQEFALRGINARFEGIFSENIFESVSLKDLLD
jgi:hypothetical protein